MSFKPTTSQVSHDKIEDNDFSISNEEAQAQRAGEMRLIGLTGAVTPVDLGWPKIDWDQESELDSFPADIDSIWDSVFNNLTPQTPQTFEFEPFSKFLSIHTEAGEHQFVYQREGGTVGKRHWADQVDNALGWTIQVRTQVVTDQTGLGLQHGHYLDIDDGAHRERIHFHQTGLAFQNNPALNFGIDLSKPKEIRIGARQDDIFVLADNGLGVEGVDAFTGASTIKELGFGTTGNVTHEYRTLFDYLHQRHGVMWVDDRDNVIAVYSTTGSTAVSPAYAPQKQISGYQYAYVATKGDLLGGTTSVLVQYRSGGGAWQDFSTVTIDTIGEQRIDLQAVPVAGDATDEIRFKVTQSSTTGAAEPPRVDTITVIANFVGDGLRVHPRWGHHNGGMTVLLDILTGAAEIESPESAAAGYDAHTLDWNAPTKYGSHTATGLAVEQALSVFQDSPYGRHGSGLTPYHPSGGALFLAESVLGESVLTGVDPHISQKVTAALQGDGVYFASPSSDDVALEVILRVSKGAVRLQQPGGSLEYVATVYDHWVPQPARVRLAGGLPFTLTAEYPDTVFEVAKISTYQRSSGSGSIAGAPHTATTEFFADANVTLHDHDADDGLSELVSRLDTLDGWELGLTKHRAPYVILGDGVRTDMLTGVEPVDLSRRTNLAVSYGPFDYHTGLQLMVDGRVVAEKVTTLDQVTQGLANIGLAGKSVASLEQVRSSPTRKDPYEFSLEAGFSAPRFQDRRAWSTDADMVVLYNFDLAGGAIRDVSGRGHHGVLTLDGRATLHRGRSFYGYMGCFFWHTARIVATHTPDQVPNFPVVIATQGVFYTSVVTQELCSKWNSTGTVGYKVEIDTNGRVAVQVKDGVSTHSLSSDSVLADRKPRSLYVSITAAGIEIRIDGVSKTSASSIASLAAANSSLTIGRQLAAWLNAFALRTSVLDGPTWDSWRDWASAKWAPADDQVYFDNTLVDNADVIHSSSTRKFVVVPTGEPGEVPVHVVVGSTVLPSERPFLYTYGYHRPLDFDRIKDRVRDTHSPFRVVNRVPDGGVNLSFFQIPEISVDRNVSHTDLSHSASENLATYFGGEFALRDPLTGDGYLTYTGQVDTRDSLLSARSVMRRDVQEPHPLFYRYLIGRGRRYVYQPNALTEDDVLVIRDGLTLVDGDGNPITFKTFPWDIAVSKKDVNGAELPTNVFSVTIFTSRPFLLNRSVMVRYAAADSINDWEVSSSLIEIVNTDAGYQKVYDQVPAQDEYNLRLTPTGYYEAEIGVTGA